MAPDLDYQKQENASLDDIFKNIDIFKQATPNDQKDRNKKYQSKIKERTYDVNLATSQMIAYDPLADEHLQDYFNSPHIRKHLVKLGLIEEDGAIVEEKLFKKKQILLDKLANESKFVDQQGNRDFGHRIEVSLRRQARKSVEKRQKLRQPGEENPSFLSKYPISMQTTAIIYSFPSKQVAKKSSKKQNLMMQQRSSLTELFELAKKEYQSGKLKLAEEKLRTLLKSVAEKTVTMVVPVEEREFSNSSSFHQKQMRPKSARPTRTSTFPVSSTFSEPDSDNEGDHTNTDYEIDGVVDDESINEVFSKSTVVSKGNPRQIKAKIASVQGKRTVANRKKGNVTEKVHIPKPVLHNNATAAKKKDPPKKSTISGEPLSLIPVKGSDTDPRELHYLPEKDAKEFNFSSEKEFNPTTPSSEFTIPTPLCNPFQQAFHEQLDTEYLEDNHRSDVDIPEAALVEIINEVKAEEVAEVINEVKAEEVAEVINEVKAEEVAEVINEVKAEEVAIKSSKSNHPSINDIHSLAKVYGSSLSLKLKQKNRSSPNGSKKNIAIGESRNSTFQLAKQTALPGSCPDLQPSTTTSKSKSTAHLAKQSVLDLSKVAKANSNADIPELSAQKSQVKSDTDIRKLSSIGAKTSEKDKSAADSSSTRGSKVKGFAETTQGSAPTVSARNNKEDSAAALKSTKSTSFIDSTIDLAALPASTNCLQSENFNEAAVRKVDKIVATVVEEKKESKNLFMKKTANPSSDSQNLLTSTDSLTKSQALLVDNILTEVYHDLTETAVKTVEFTDSAKSLQRANSNSKLKEGLRSSDLKSKSKESILNQSDSESFGTEEKPFTPTVIHINETSPKIIERHGDDSLSSVQTKDQIKIFSLDQKLERPRSFRGSIGKSMMKGITELGADGEEGGTDVPKSISIAARKSTKRNFHPVIEA